MFNKERGRTEYPRKRIEKERKGLMYNGNLQVHSPPTNVTRVRFPDSASYVG